MLNNRKIFFSYYCYHYILANMKTTVRILPPIDLTSSRFSQIEPINRLTGGVGQCERPLILAWFQSSLDWFIQSISLQAGHHGLFRFRWLIIRTGNCDIGLAPIIRELHPLVSGLNVSLHTYIYVLYWRKLSCAEEVTTCHYLKGFKKFTTLSQPCCGVV